MAITVAIERSPGGGNGWCLTVRRKRKWLAGKLADALFALGCLVPMSADEQKRVGDVVERELRRIGRVELLVEVAS